MLFLDLKAQENPLSVSVLHVFFLDLPLLVVMLHLT